MVIVAKKIIYPLLFIVLIGSIPLLYQSILYSTPSIIYLSITFVGMVTAFVFVKVKWKNSFFHTLPLLKIFQISLLCYCLYLIFIATIRYFNFESEIIDLSYYHIAVWQLSEFHIPHIWDIPSRFVWDDHFEPILLLFVPFYWISKTATWLFVSQVIIVVSGVIPLYCIVKEKFNDDFLGISMSFSYLLFGGLQMGYGYGFHPIVLFPTLFFWTYYFLEKKKVSWYIFFLFLTLCIKEEIAFTAIAFGFYLLLFKENKKLALLTIGMGIGWYFLCFNIIFPYFSHGKGFGHFGQYGELGSEGIIGLVKNVFVKPELFFTTLVTPAYKIDTFFHSFGSFAFLPFFAPQTLIIIIPSLIEKLLSSNIAGWNGFHYSAVITGVILISSIESLAYIYKQKFHFFTVFNNTHYWAFLILYVAFFTNVMFGYGYFSLVNNKSVLLNFPGHVSLVYEIIDSLPTNASVSAQYQIAPHINRPYLKIMPAPNGNESSDYVVLNLNLPLVLTTPQLFNDYLVGLSQNPKYKVIYQKNKVMVFKRK